APRRAFSVVTETRLGILQYFPDRDRVGRSIGWYGEYLQPQLDLLGRLIKPGATVVEVGAGIGLHSLFLANAVGEQGHLLLCESHPPSRRVLQQNLAAHRVTNITLMRRTLGRPRPDVEKIECAASSDVATVTLDELQLERL